MEKLTHDLVLLTLSELAVVYPAASVDDEQVQAMADLWLEDLGELTPNQFRSAVKYWRTHQRFFPTVADIMQTRRELDAQTPTNAQVALPERPWERSDEELSHNKRQCQRIIDMLAQKRRARVQ